MSIVQKTWIDEIRGQPVDIASNSHGEIYAVDLIDAWESNLPVAPRRKTQAVSTQASKHKADIDPYCSPDRGQLLHEEWATQQHRRKSFWKKLIDWNF